MVLIAKVGFLKKQKLHRGKHRLPNLRRENTTLKSLALVEEKVAAGNAFQNSKQIIAVQHESSPALLANFEEGIEVRSRDL